MGEITIDTWLYGDLAHYGGVADQGSFAHLALCLPAGCTIHDLLAKLEMPGEARGLTFINGQLSAMPGVQPDLNHPLQDGDRVAFFHPLSMWPFQYRFGASMVEEMNATLNSAQEKGLHHSYRENK